MDESLILANKINRTLRSISGKVTTLNFLLLRVEHQKLLQLLGEEEETKNLSNYDVSAPRNDFERFYLYRDSSKAEVFSGATSKCTYSTVSSVATPHGSSRKTENCALSESSVLFGTSVASPEVHPNFPNSNCIIPEGTHLPPGEPTPPIKTSSSSEILKIIRSTVETTNGLWMFESSAVMAEHRTSSTNVFARNPPSIFSSSPTKNPLDLDVYFRITAEENLSARAQDISLDLRKGKPRKEQSLEEYKLVSGADHSKIRQEIFAVDSKLPVSSIIQGSVTQDSELDVHSPANTSANGPPASIARNKNPENQREGKVEAMTLPSSPISSSTREGNPRPVFRFGCGNQFVPSVFTFSPDKNVRAEPDFLNKPSTSFSGPQFSYTPRAKSEKCRFRRKPRYRRGSKEQAKKASSLCPVSRQCEGSVT